MAPIGRRYPKEEFARRGDEVYERVVRPNLKPEDFDRFVAVDIETEQWAIDDDELEACNQLRHRVSDAQIWMVRVGSRYVHWFGGGERRIAAAEHSNSKVSPRSDSEDWTRGDFTISTDRARLDLDVIHGFVSRSYWAKDRTRERVAEAIAHSLPFGLYHRDAQIGFARVVTDHVVIAFLADVFVLEPYRRQGLGRWLVEVVTSHPDLRSIRRWLLGTRDAHELYRRFGFREPTPGVLMERLDPDSR